MPAVRTLGLLRVLRDAAAELHGVEWLKLVCRPLVCPYADLLRHIESENVFDIGCGSGAFALLATRTRPVRRFGGCDVSAARVATAQRLLRAGLPAAELDLRCIPPDAVPALGDYGLVFLTDVLHHVPRDRHDTFLRRIAARMQAGARLILTDIDAGSKLVLFNRIHDRLLNAGGGQERRIADVEALLRAGGLRILGVTRRRQFVYPHFTIVAAKGDT